jgi:hypothetical protein
MDTNDFSRETVHCEWEYYAFSEGFRAQITLQQYISIKNPGWSKYEVTEWANRAERIKSKTNRWREAQINPTPIRSRQHCYNCKVPWEPDHRCRGKGKRHIIEVHYENEDEDMHGDATIDAYLAQSNDTSDSCTLVEASDSCALGEDSDPFALEG